MKWKELLLLFPREFSFRRQQHGITIFFTINIHSFSMLFKIRGQTIFHTTNLLQSFILILELVYWMEKKEEKRIRPPFDKEKPVKDTCSQLYKFRFSPVQNWRKLFSIKEKTTNSESYIISSTTFPVFSWNQVYFFFRDFNSTKFWLLHKNAICRLTEAACKRYLYTFFGKAKRKKKKKRR